MKPFNEFSHMFTSETLPGTESRSMALEVLANGLIETLGIDSASAMGAVLGFFGRCMQAAAKHRLEPGDSVTVSLYAEGLDYAPGETSPCPRQGYSVTAERTETGFAYTTRGFVYHRRGAPTDAVNDVRTRLIRAGQNMGVTV